MNKNNKRWRNGDLVRAIPITRGDLHQAIARVGFRPEHTPEPGKDRWYSWRDVVAIAAAQELRIIGHGPKIAFGLVQDQLSPFLRTCIDQPGNCAGVLWLIYKFEDRLRKGNRCEFVQYSDAKAHMIGLGESACIVVNVGRIARLILDKLQEQQVDVKAWAAARAAAIADARAEFDAHVRAAAE
ncbi:MAG: hypothetical protein Q8O82_13290 [Pseudorhodobacter sp.]|nr:hypothetical protein [Pseudorhodobacter sp.]